MDGGQLPAAGRPVWVRVSVCRRARIFAAKLNKMLKNRANSCKIRSVFFLRKKTRFCCVLCVFFKKCGKIGGFQWVRPGRPRCDVPYTGKFRRIRPIYLSTASPPCRSQKRFCHKSGQRRRKNTILPGFAHFFAKTWQNRRIPAGMSRLGSVLYPIF